MVTVTRPNNLVIDSAQGTIDYLIGVAVRPRVPYERGTWVNITDHTPLPSNVAAWDVGIIVESPSDSPTCAILVLNQDGSTAVVAIPKVNITAR